jgi:putative peptidoglycan lipid II flippase
MEFPLGVFAIALAAASLPAMSRQAAAGDVRALATTLNFTLRLALAIAVPATVGLVLLRTPIIRVLFERGLFGADDTAATAQALLWYAVGLIGFSLARIVAQVFYAMGAPGAAVRLGLVSVAVNIVAAVALMGPLAHGGLALASSIGGYVNAALLLWVVRRRLGGFGGRAIAASLARTIAASAPLAAWCALALRTWPGRPTVIVDIAWLAVTIGGGALVFAGSCRLLAPREFAALRGILPLGRRR